MKEIEPTNDMNVEGFDISSVKSVLSPLQISKLEKADSLYERITDEKIKEVAKMTSHMSMILASVEAANEGQEKLSA